MLSVGSEWKRRVVLALLVFLPAPFGVHSAGTFLVNDYGAAPDDANDDSAAIRKALDLAIAAGPDSIVRFGSGVYRVSSNTSLTVTGAAGLTIEGAGFDTELIMTDPRIRAVYATASSGVALRNFTIDWDPPPFTQGTIAAVDRGAGTYDLRIEPGFPSMDEDWFLATPESGKWGMVFDRTERRLKTGAADFTRAGSWSEISPGVFRIRVQSGEEYKLADFEVDDRFAHLSRGGGNAILFRDVIGGSIENVRIHASPGLCAGIVASSGITVDNMQVTYRAGTDRLLTSDADGVHCQQCRGPVIIQNSLFEGMADDGTAMYTIPGNITEVVSSTTVRYERGVPIEPGDRIQIFDPVNGRIRATVVASASSRIDSSTREVTFSPAVNGIVAGTDHTNADTLNNLSACGSGSIIRNNIFRNPRRYGVYQKGGGVLIENNRVERVGGWGIVVANEPTWPEGPVPWGVTVRGNTISGVARSSSHYGANSGGAAIYVAGKKLTGLANGRVATDIAIENNTITDPPGAGIFVGSAETVRITGNSISAELSDPPHRNAGAVILDNCKDVDIDRLTVNDLRPETIAGIHIRSNVWPGEEGVVWTRLNTVINAGSVRVRDDRPSSETGVRQGWETYR